MSRTGLAAVVFAAGLVSVTQAHAMEVLRETVAAAKAVERDCTRQQLPGAPGVVRKELRVPASGWVSARLRGGGDWDLAVFDLESGRLVAGSGSAGSSEVASGLARLGDRLVVQACRRSGSKDAALTVDSFAVDTAGARPVQLVRVSVPNAERLRELAGLGIDLTEHGGKGFVDAVAYGPGDVRKLATAGFIATTRVRDLVAQDRRFRAADRAYAASTQASALPSSRTTYRRLFDYQEELKRLAVQNPDLVRHITLPFPTWEGRAVEGIEITTDPGARDGKPVFLQMGVHHAREWPSGEHAMEWAYELINGYRAGDERVTRLVQSTRTLVVPIVNPDGFNISREAGEAAGAGGGRGGEELANLAIPYEYQRKNCRMITDEPAGNCLQQPATGLLQYGVDPNRNYGGLWGGPGASPPGGVPPGQLNQDYRGPGPFSEPETQNIRDLVSKRQVTTLITNHTFSNLVLRPPGTAEMGDTPDEPVYKSLGDSMAAENGYASQFSYQLYDTTGTTEDWTYWSTGGLGFTFEIGPTNFHPPFAESVAEYEGTTAAAGEGGGNREAYFKAAESTADASMHSVIEGRARAGATLRLKKTFLTSTSPVVSADGTTGEPQLFEDTLETTLSVPADRRFTWHVNPSTRPIVGRSTGREPTGDPSPPVELSGGPDPAEAKPCADFNTEDATCFNDHPFEVPSGEGIDNAKATVRIEWPTPASDWDMKVFRDSNGDGSSVGETELVASSAAGVTNFEEAPFAEPVLTPGAYVVRVINFAAAEPYTGSVSFAGPEPGQQAQVEAWTLTCELDGRVRQSLQVIVARGQRASVRLNKCR